MKMDFGATKGETLGALAFYGTSATQRISIVDRSTFMGGDSVMIALRVGEPKPVVPPRPVP